MAVATDIHNIDVGVGVNGLPGCTRIGRFEGALPGGTGVDHTAVMRVNGNREHQCLAQAVGRVGPGSSAVGSLQEIVEGSGGAVHDVGVVQVHNQVQATPVATGPMRSAIDGLEEAVELRIDIDYVGICGRHGKAGNGQSGQAVVGRTEGDAPIRAFDDATADTADVNRM